MDNRYKAIFSNKRIYKEVELPYDSRIVKVGTKKSCDVRFSKDQFFEEFEIVFENTGHAWQVNSEDNIYISVDGVMKLTSRILTHGEEFLIKYQDSNQEIFKVSFMLDFDFEKKDYDRIIDISNISQLRIGNSDKYEICLNEPLLGADVITVSNNNGKFSIHEGNTKYGVYVNGGKIRGSAELSDYDFFSVVGYSFYLKYGKLYTSKSNKIQISDVNYTDSVDQTSHLKYPKFNRNTRVQYVIPEDEIEIQQPQPKPKKPRKNIIVSIIPALAMLALMVILRGFMGGGGGGTFIIYSACSMSIGIVMSVVAFIMDGKQYKDDIAEREKYYLLYIQKKETEITAIRDEELHIRETIHESLEKSVEEVRAFGRRLFEKDINDKDFLDVRIGDGAVEAKCKVKYTKQEFVDMNDDISQLPEQIDYKYRYINNAPIIARFSKSCGVGVIGQKDKLYDIMKNMTLDLSIRHFYKDIKLFYMFDSADIEQLKWLRWLKHVHNDELDITNFMCDEESKNILLELIYSELSKRETEKRINGDIHFLTHYVVFVFDSKDIVKHPISKFFESSKEYGFTFVFFEKYEELLPKGCTDIIRLNDNDEMGIILSSMNGLMQSKFSYHTVNDGIAEEISLKLSATYVDEVSLESELTKNITIFELLHIMNIDDLDLEERWTNSKVYKSMAAPLGVKRKNEVVYLDISDKATAHGPHGLVAGTTGSGKSEILQSYVLSMASLFHPYDVGFVIIDFKGGGMANQFKDLPHLIGAITNIDGREINRSLLSIKAELVHRQELFSQNGVNHINDYIQLFKSGKVSQPLPHLIMIVDEFAELKAEFPEFMKEIVSAARIGRTLGVHLILATQKPSGVVDNQIWSNSKFKLCLKVQTKEDSNEVIKTPLAAEIVEPGRAYLQVGNNEIFELFQSAYSGDKVIEGNDENAKVYSIFSLNAWGKRELVYTNKKGSSTKAAKNQLQVMVDYISDYCSDQGIEKLNGICLPPLADKIFAFDLLPIKKDLVKGICIPIGIYDDPEQQKQDSLILNLSESNTYIVGSAQTGKTTLLQTVIYEIMNIYTPKEVNIYVIDCGNMALKVFDEAHHVGGVVLAVEEERVINLFKLLSNTIGERKKLLAKKGLGSFKAYVEAGFTDIPQILLMIDNMAAFRENYSKFDEEFLNLSREGQSVGINIIATGAQTNAIGFRVLANFGNRIAFNCNDKAEYSNLFDRCRIEPKETQGRGLCIIDKRIIEFHALISFEGEKEITRVENMKLFIKNNSKEYMSEKAIPIPEVPAIIKRSELYEANKNLYLQPYQIPIGIDYATVAYRYIDLMSVGLFAVSGKEKSGKTNFIRHILHSIQQNIFNNLTEAYVIDSDDMQLEDFNGYGFVKEYTSSASSIGFILNTIYEKLEERQTVVSKNRGKPIEEILKDEPLILLIIDNYNVIAELNKDKELQTKLNNILKQFRKLKVAIIFSDIENSSISFNSPEMMKVMKENKKFVVFDDIESVKVFDVTMKQMKEYAKPIKPGDAFLCLNGEISKVKTILND